MARWNRFLASLDTVRDVARELALYGCHTRSELEKRLIKARRYDEALRSLRAFSGRYMRTAPEAGPTPSNTGTILFLIKATISGCSTTVTPSPPAKWACRFSFSRLWLLTKA